jgi:hypothetical protein
MTSPLAVSPPSNSSSRPSTLPMSFLIPSHFFRHSEDSVGPICIPSSAISQPPSPLVRLGAPSIPVSCQMSNDFDIAIPAYHRFHNDSHFNSSPTSSRSSISEGLSLPSCDFPPRFEQFRNSRSRVLLVSSTLVLYAFQYLMSCLKLQKDRRWPLSSFVSFFIEVRANHR